ncbi:hypothetical protein F5884DRAFT_809078 [Xylogone sp. PMI_703]|nr:hypothetical protein F5884DRAFT_809078 [Xylogone sp. PMI_703]
MTRSKADFLFALGSFSWSVFQISSYLVENLLEYLRVSHLFDRLYEVKLSVLELASTRRFPTNMRQCFQIPKDPRYPYFANSILSHAWFQSLWTCYEILLVVVSSIITSAYAFTHNKRSSGSDGERIEPQPIISLFQDPKFSVDPSPTLVLVSCLVCGLSVSSHTYRHPKRRGIVVLVVVTACCVAFYLNISASLILAVVIPWAVSITMICSMLHQRMPRWCGWKFEELKGAGKSSRSGWK